MPNDAPPTKGPLNESPTCKPRIAFDPIKLLFVVSLFLCGGVVMTLVPLFECNNCFGVGSFTREERQRGEQDAYGIHRELVPRNWTCRLCSGSGSIPGLYSWDVGPRPRNQDETLMRAILKRRQLTLTVR